MQLNNMKKIERIAKQFNKINRLSKIIIKYGFLPSLRCFYSERWQFLCIKRCFTQIAIFII